MILAIEIILEDIVRNKKNKNESGDNNKFQSNSAHKSISISAQKSWSSYNFEEWCFDFPPVQKWPFSLLHPHTLNHYHFQPKTPLLSLSQSIPYVSHFLLRRPARVPPLASAVATPRYLPCRRLSPTLLPEKTPKVPILNQTISSLYIVVNFELVELFACLNLMLEYVFLKLRIVLFSCEYVT